RASSPIRGARGCGRKRPLRRPLPEEPMPALKRLSEQVRVGPQLSVEDIAALAKEGVKVVINNRPDGESPDQPPNAALAAAAEQAGIAYRHIPIAGGAVTPEAVKAMAEAL